MVGSMAGDSAGTAGIRPAHPGDAQVIAEVHVAAWQAAYRGLIPQDYLDTLDLRERCSRWQQILGRPTQPGQGTLAAHLRDNVVGFASFGPSRDSGHDTGTGEIYALYLHPGAWGRGIGRQLMAAAVGALADARYPQATLWVLESNTRARRFYEAAGWHPDGTTQTDDTMGTPLHEVRYTRPLHHKPDTGRAR